MKCLEDGQASISKFTMDKAHFVICGHKFEISDVQQATELYDIPSVTEQWIQASVRLGKLASCKPYDPISNKIFSNCIFTLSGVEIQDRRKLYAMITFHGGIVQKHFDSKLTHLVCTNAIGVAYVKAMSFSKRPIIIAPDWIIDCVKLKKQIDVDAYHPSLLLTSTIKPKIGGLTLDIAAASAAGIKEEKIIGLSSLTNQQPLQQNPQNIRMSMIRNQLQQNVRPQANVNRPLVVHNMQHTPQQINEILQNQIQQQQLQQQLQEQQQTQQNQIATNQNQQPLFQVNQSKLRPVVQTSQSVAQQPIQEPVVQQPLPQIPQTSNNQLQLNVQQQPANAPSPQLTPVQQQQQRQQLMQQMEARNQKIQLISQHLQQSSQNQQMLSQQQFQNKQQFQSSQQTVNSPGGNNPQLPQQMVQNQMVVQQQQFPNQQIKQMLNTGSQNPQVISNQIVPAQSGLNKNVVQQQQQQQPGNGTTNNYIQIIQGQTGQQIIQIQHPEGGPAQQIIQQKTIPQSIQQTQQPAIGMNPQNQGNQAMTGSQHLTQQPQVMSQSANQMPMPQQGTATGGAQSQLQGNQQNIVIINQLQQQQLQQQQQSGNQIPMHQQRFQSIQGQSQLLQKQHIVNQQIIQQKLTPGVGANQVVLNNNPQMQGTNTQQIIQVHQSPISGENIILEQQQKLGNVVHIQSQQQQQQQQQPLTQQQAVHQIAQQLQNVQGTSAPVETNQQQHMPQQMNVLQTQGLPQGQVQQPQSPQQWIPQSPTQQGQQQQLPGTPQSPVIQHIITATQPGPNSQTQFIRQPRYMYLDAQTSLQFQRMDQAQRQEYLEQLHNKQHRGAMIPQQLGFQQRASAPNVSGGRPHHIVIRSQVPPGMNRQQQVQWIQSHRRQIVIRPGGVPAGALPANAINQNPNATPGLSPINTGQPQQPGQPQVGQNPAAVQFQVDPNTSPQQQQQIQRQHYQRLQQLQQQQQQQQGQKLQPGIQPPVSPRGTGFPNDCIDPTLGDPTSSAKTKTALANMLSSRLGGNNGNIPIIEQNVEPSASGTLRMMTAQHNASLNVQSTVPPGVSVRNTQNEMMVLQQQHGQQQNVNQQIPPQQQQLQQQRRTLGNITNSSAPGVPTSPVIVTGQMPSGTQVIMPQSPSGMKGQAPFSPGRAPLNRAQFYGHNPNLKLPVDLFLLGCHFLIVEYDETNTDDLSTWRQVITNHGGDIESNYNLRVTHVLCRTQKHGIVMQAIRDNKRCVTVYWLNDIMLKKQVQPPWQAIHLPTPSVFGPTKPGSKHVITILGFENEERERVKQMIKETGARLTSFMNRQNTIVISKKLDTAHKKYLRAKEFNIPLVNVVWLSDMLLGNTSTTAQYESPKYQQYTLPQPLRIDHNIVPHLMSKFCWITNWRFFNDKYFYEF